ncbi:MAG TPA: ABC transporter permease [Actinomycetota bacterium]|jgi:ABC-2 type transport system permease protein
MKRRVWALIRKEFAEYRRNKLIVITMTLLPAAFLFVAARAAFALPAHASPTLIRAVFGQARLFLLILPLFLPSTIAAYSVIGEREQGALEPVLTTPATDGELLLGKAVAPAVPAIGLSWLLYVAYLVFAVAIGKSVALHEMATGTQLLAEGVLAPTLAGYSIILGLLISARSTDIRVAQQLSALASLPLLAVVAISSFQLAGKGPGFYLAASAVVLLIDAVGLVLTTRAFNRERLLSRYGN